MQIKCFGLFWRRDEVDWNPGKGNKDAFRLLGRRGKNQPTLRVADFRFQQGIYILYGNHGPYYVGLTREQGLGKRLKDHLTDKHAERWDRFSWFGFQKVLEKKDGQGIRQLGALASVTVGSPHEAITDIEALLIRAMGLSNLSQMKFSAAEEWCQIKEHEVSGFLAKVK